MTGRPQNSADETKPAFDLRSMQREDWPGVARLIHESTNTWYVSHGRPAVFACPPEDVTLFCSVYEALDPGCCILAEEKRTGRIAASCFYHPRETHVSLGIMNSHPDYAGRGLAGKLLRHITDFADRSGKPVRLVSSAVNLDSFSLYSRHGFVPRQIFQDMILTVPENGLHLDPPGADRVREGRLGDVPAMVALEMDVSGIRREKDFRYFLENAAGIWHVSVLEGAGGTIEGFLVSVAHPASRMLGPGVMRTEEQAAALIHSELNRHRGMEPVWLVPSESPGLVRRMYEWGVRNCEIHFAQARGVWKAPTGIVMPTFMPETG